MEASTLFDAGDAIGGLLNFSAPLSQAHPSPPASPPYPEAPVQTYHTNTLGLFSSEDQPLHAAAQPALSNLFPSSSNDPPRRQLQIDTWEIEGGWTKNPFGTDYIYVGHGKIEEVDENEEAPRTAPSTVLSHFSQQLPEATTPPPRPAARQMDLPSSSPGSESANHVYPLLDFSALDRNRSRNTSAGVLSAISPLSPFTNTNNVPKIAVVGETLDALGVAQREMETVWKNLVDLSYVLDVRPHMEICALMLQSLRLLADRIRVYAGIDSSREDGNWAYKCDSRLHSLRRTLRRLRDLIRLPLRRTKLDALHRKLAEHNLKICDLSDKFQDSFTKLHLQCIHALLSEKHQALSVELASTRRRRRTGRTRS